MEDNIYYVYCYLDTRKPGNYCYWHLCFEYQPFYIGKGSGRREVVHLDEAYFSNSDSYKCNKIRKIKQETGNDPLVIRIFDGLSEQKALELERKIVEEIGTWNGHKYNHKVGCLTNNCPGGGNPPRAIKGEFHTSRASKDGSHWWFGSSNPVHDQIAYRAENNLPNPMVEWLETNEHWWLGENNPIHKRIANGDCVGNSHHYRNRDNQKQLDEELLDKLGEFRVCLTNELSRDLGFIKRQNLYNCIKSRIAYKEIPGKYLEKLDNGNRLKSEYYLVSTGGTEKFYKQENLLFRVVKVNDIC